MMPSQNTIAWIVAALFALLYARAVFRLYRRRKEAEFWRNAAAVGTVAGFAGGVWLGFKGAKNDADAAALGVED